MVALTDNLLLQVASVIRDEVTTTDELIPSGETASYRSNPYKISEFTLIRKDPHYVGNAKAIQEYETARRNGDAKKTAEVYEVLKAAGSSYDKAVKTTCFLADMGDFAAFNEIYGKYFTGKPARSCVAVKTLPKNVLCEVEVIAEV